MTSSEFFADINARMKGYSGKPQAIGAIFCVDGTAYPGTPGPPSFITDDGNGFWSGFSSGIAGGLANVADGMWASRLVPYNTLSPIPSNKARDRGIAALAKMVGDYADNFFRNNGNSYNGLATIFSGYSLGAIITATYWQTYVLNPSGPHHYLMPYIYRIYQFGDPMRTAGIAHGNALAGLSESIKADSVETGGIALNLNVTVEQSNMKAPDGNFIYCSCANKGDIYTACPIGLDVNKPAAAGAVGNRAFKMIMDPSISSITGIANALKTPVGMVEEIFNGMSFAAKGVNAPHWHYEQQMNACINDAVELGERLIVA